MINDVWWIFSQNHSPRHLTGNLHPIHSKDLQAAWAYYINKDLWYWFDEYARNWSGNWSRVKEIKNIPNEYLIQLLLVKT